MPTTGAVLMGRRRTKNLHLPPRLQLRRGRYYWTPYRDGKVRWQSLGTDYAQALARWADLEGQSSRIAQTVWEAIDAYLIAMPTLRRPQGRTGLAEATKREYRQYAARLRLVFGHCGLPDVKRSDIGAYLDQHPHPKLANREVSMLSSVYEYAMRKQWAEANPCRGIRRNPEARSLRYVTDAELAVLATAREPVGTVSALILCTAMRKRDILNIRFSDWTDQGLQVRFSKTGRTKIFEPTPSLVSIIERAKSIRRGAKRVGSLYLFARRDGKAYTSSGFDSIWQREIRRLGLKNLGPHALRARALTDARNQFGRDYAQDLADHADGSTTELYVRGREIQKVRPLER